MAALIGALRVSLSADTAKFEQGMKRSQATARQASGSINKSLGGIKAGFAGLAAGLSIGLITRAIGNALEYAGSLGEVAQQLGVTTKELQTFRFAAGQNGASVEEADKVLGKFSLSISKVRAGSVEMTKAFGAVGVKLADLEGKSKTQILGQIADGMKATGGASANAAAGVAIFGKGFQKIIPTLDLGSKGMSELAQAAEELGIVLSDEQIRKADETADKLEALKTVLKARIAGEVADNSDAILGLASALTSLVGAIGTVARGWKVFMAELQAGAPALALLAVAPGPALSMYQQLADKAGNRARVGPGAKSITMKLPPLKQHAASGPDIGKFLAPGGGGHKARADHSAEDRLRDSFQFDQQIRAAQMDVLRAQQDMAANYIERTTIGIEILNAEQAARDAEHQYQIALFKLTKGKQGMSEAQVAQLKAEEGSVDALQRKKILDDEQLQRAEDVQALTQGDFDRRKDALQAQLQIAETADERRKIELELLQIAYDQKRQALQNIIDTSKDIAAIENARRDLVNLKSTFGSDRQAVIQNTRGPMEDFLASLPTTAAKANEALQQLEVEGFNGLIDSVLALSEGVGSATDALLGTVKAFLLGLARMELQKLLASSLGPGGFLSGLGFASGGFTGNISPNRFAGFVHGSEGVLNAGAMHRLGVPALNALNRGAPLSAVIGNDNGSHRMGGRGDVYMTVVTPDSDSFRRSEGQTTRGLRRKLA